MNSFDKQTMRQWLYEIDKVKAENKRLEELLTKSWDKRIEVLIKENRELRKDKELLLSDYEWLLEDKRELEKENKELKWKLNLLTNQK